MSYGRFQATLHGVLQDGDVGFLKDIEPIAGNTNPVPAGSVAVHIGATYGMGKFLPRRASITCEIIDSPVKAGTFRGIDVRMAGIRVIGTVNDAKDGGAFGFISPQSLQYLVPEEALTPLPTTDVFVRSTELRNVPPGTRVSLGLRLSFELIKTNEAPRERWRAIEALRI